MQMLTGRYRYLISILGVLVLCCSPEEQASVPPDRVLVQGSGFRVTVPPNVHVCEHWGVDFEIYIFATSATCDSPFMHAYEGSHPNFEQTRPYGRTDMIHVNERINGLDTRTVRGGNTLLSRGSLVRVWSNRAAKRRRVPPFVHFFYVDLPPGQAALADSIIATVARRTNRPTGR